MQSQNLNLGNSAGQPTWAPQQTNYFLKRRNENVRVRPSKILSSIKAMMKQATS
jgi:hypothetical protein